MTPDEFRQAVQHEIEEALDAVTKTLEALRDGSDPITCIQDLEAIGHNTEIAAMMLARKAPRE